MEKKTKLFLIAMALMLAGLGGTILGFKMAGNGREGVAPRSGLNDREIKELERGLEEGSGRSIDNVEGAIGTVGSIEERERSGAEGLGIAADGARNIEEGIMRIGEDSAGIGNSLENIGRIVEELRKRAEGKDQ